MLSVDTWNLPPPVLEFGGDGDFTDPKAGIEAVGPFSLRFGSAHKAEVRVGLVGPSDLFPQATQWFKRCQTRIESGKANREMYPDFPGFQVAFRSSLQVDQRWRCAIKTDALSSALSKSARERFEEVLQLYETGIERLADRETRPDVVVCCLPNKVVDSCWSVENPAVTAKDKRWAKWEEKERGAGQMLLFGERPVEETAEDLLYRNFRRALKARAMKYRMPIQIGTPNLFLDSDKNQDPATRAWNVGLALFYKAGGIPWRLRSEGPETCFVGVSFHHLRTSKRHLVYSSLAQAFSTEGDGFALRGEAMPWDEERDRHPHLNEDQATRLVESVLDEYRERTGHEPARVVLHKTSMFDEAEQQGFRSGLRRVPLVEMVNILPTRFRLVQRAVYPPSRGTICHVNRSTTYLYTTGFIPEWGTYPGPHVPAPVWLRTVGDADVIRIAADILALARVNWNTARDTSGVPITLRFARDVGGIMAEVDPRLNPNPSYRFYM